MKKREKVCHVHLKTLPCKTFLPKPSIEKPAQLHHISPWHKSISKIKEQENIFMLTFHIPSAIIMTLYITWTITKTNKRIWSWCMPSSCIKGAFPCIEKCNNKYIHSLICQSHTDSSFNAEKERYQNIYYNIYYLTTIWLCFLFFQNPAESLSFNFFRFIFLALQHMFGPLRWNTQLNDAVLSNCQCEWNEAHKHKFCNYISKSNHI